MCMWWGEGDGKDHFMAGMAAYMAGRLYGGEHKAKGALDQRMRHVVRCQIT